MAKNEIKKEKERFSIRFRYLKDATSVKYFHRSLPKHIIPKNNANILKDTETAYNNCGVTYEQYFTTTEHSLVEEDVCHAWFSSKPSLEDMAWIEIIRKKRSYPESVRHGEALSFRGVRVVGGSMTSPVTFVQHCDLSKNFQNDLNFSFQPESSMFIIEKECSLEDIIAGNDSPQFTLEAAFDSLHDTVVVHKGDTYIAMLLNLKFSTKIYNRAGKFYRDKRGVANHTGFDDIGCVNTYCLRLDFDRHEYSKIKLFLSCLICNRFYVAYADLKVTLTQYAKVSLPTRRFEVAYAWECVQSLGFKVTDHISPEVKRYIEILMCRKTTLIPQIFYNLSEQLMDKPFFLFKDELDLIVQRTTQSGSSEKESPPHHSMVPRMVLTPTKLVYLPKEPVFQNRILRKYGQEFFIKVVIRDEDFTKLCSVQSFELNNILERMKTVFKDGFEIQECHYEFLGCSNSQLREHSFWFFHPHDGINSEFIRNSSGDLSSEMCVASYVSRFGLCFSSSQKTVDIDKSCVVYVRDVKNDQYCFTDGIGCISPRLAEKVANELGIQPTPSAFQIRFGGCKGVVAQNPMLRNEDVLWIGESMRKFESKSNNLEILEVTRPVRLHLNRQVITLLSALGIPDHVFLNLQERMLIDMADMLIDDEKALAALEEVCFRSRVGMNVSLLANRGISFVQEPFFRSLLHSIYNNKLKTLMRQTRIQIPLDKGRYMMGTSDETRTLESGQVFIQYSKDTHLPGENVIVVEGDVVVTKNPCFHEGDIRVFQAVNIPRLRHMVDCIVFPQLGLRPHPDEMSGSDLDGDEYFVCWDEDLCKIKNHEPMDFPKAKKKCLTREVTSDDIIDFLADYIRHDKLGLIANAHLVQADRNEKGIFSDECHKLAEMHSDAVDFPKTGNCVNIVDKLRPKEYPDFMMKKDKKIYSSTKIIGKLFRQCRSIHWMQKQHNLNVDAMEDFFPLKIDDVTMREAKYQKNLYQNKVLEVLRMYGINTEAEALTGLIQSVKQMNGCLKDEKFKLGQIVKERMSQIQKETKKEFYKESRLMSTEQNRNIHFLKKALAWYLVTYDVDHAEHLDPNRPILSFPWIVGDILVSLKRFTTIESSGLDIFLKEYYEVSQRDRRRKIDSLDMMTTYIESILMDVQPENVEIIRIGLESCGILKRQQHLNIMIRGLQPPVINETLKKKGLVNTSKALQDPRFLVIPDDKDKYVRIIRNDRILKLSKMYNDYLTKYSCLRPAVQFIQDLLSQNVLPEDSDCHCFADLIAIVIAVLSLSCSKTIHFCVTETSKKDSVKHLLRILKNFILNFRSTKMSAAHSLTALNISSEIMAQIAKTFLIVYQKIAQNDRTRNPFFQCVNGVNADDTISELDDDEHNEVFDLPMNILNSIICAEIFIEFQLSQKSGADVLFYNCQKGPMKFEAWGTERSIAKIKEIIDKILMTPKSKLSASNGQIIADAAYSLIFEGGCEESELLFVKCPKMASEHQRRKEVLSFSPILKQANTHRDIFWRDFEEKFVQQWNDLKSEYNEPGVDLSTDTISIILERLGFFCLNNQEEKKISVRINGESPVFCNFDQNGELVRMNFADIKWSMLTFVPEGPQYHKQFTNIRFRLQSFREVDRKNVVKMEEYTQLVQRGKVLKATPSGYIIDAFFQKKDITFAREKIIKTYHNLDCGDDFAGVNLKVEVAKVTELKPNTGMTQLHRINSSKIEVIFSPYVPQLESTDENLRSYARHILEKSLRLAREFEKMQQYMNLI
uniref:RNA-directed RNA polymerase n=1 Tax=Crassostrea virginica TaxID=6565 RepID=A0A8B8AXH3_CRAVI|nr:uncharacterized protein LOC111105743 isoform X2 [Crassostrea virginica]